MSNPGLVPVVEAVCASKVHNSEMFTAHDVTVEVRQKGQRTGHEAVRDAVHDFYSRGGMGVAYTRTQITVPGGNPYLYHRTVDDPTAYSNIRGGPPVPVAGNSVIAIPTNLVAAVNPPAEEDEEDGDEDDGSPVPVPVGLSVAGVAVATRSKLAGINRVRNFKRTVARTVDGRATLSVPANILREAGFKPLQKVYLYANNGAVDIDAVAPNGPAGPVVSKYTVDSRCQVRITQSFLKRAGIGGATYDVSRENGIVKVKLHK